MDGARYDRTKKKAQIKKQKRTNRNLSIRVFTELCPPSWSHLTTGVDQRNIVLYRAFQSISIPFFAFSLSLSTYLPTYLSIYLSLFLPPSPLSRSLSLSLSYLSLTLAHIHSITLLSLSLARAFPFSLIFLFFQSFVRHYISAYRNYNSFFFNILTHIH